MDSGEEIYRQLVAAYNTGAKYGVIFNVPQLEGNDYGVMTDDHFEALERREITSKHKPDLNLIEPEAALVLPKNYGWGMRRPHDII